VVCNNNNNKWSKNFDERPHRPATVTSAAAESILKPRFRRDALSPWTRLQPMLLRRLLLTQSNAFQWGTTPNCPPPWGGGSRPHLINTWYGSLGPAESTSLTASRLVQSFCVQQTHTDRPRSVCIYQQAASLHAIRKVAHTRLPSVVFRS